MSLRLKAEFWVKAYIRRCYVADAPAFVVRHGDDDAGAVYIKIDCLNGTGCLLGPAPAGLDDMRHDRQFVYCMGPSPVPAEDIARYLEREMRIDSDIWIVEVEDRAGRSFLESELSQP